MKLINFRDFKLEISEEALCLRAFRDLWERDKSEDKNRALLEFGMLYFMYDPRSDYQYILNDEERFEILKKQEGIPNKWNLLKDKTFLAAVEQYKFLTETTNSLLLKDYRQSIENVRLFLKEVDLNATDDNGKLKYPFATVASTLKQIPELVKTVSELEKTINSEVEEQSRLKGQNLKKIFEDGLRL